MRVAPIFYLITITFAVKYIFMKRNIISISRMVAFAGSIAASVYGQAAIALVIADALIISYIILPYNKSAV